MYFYFYDLETSGFSPKNDRVMQFAGQRLDENLDKTGSPDEYFIKLTPDILPDPGAVLVTGITPQQTLEEGVTEAEFLKIFNQDIAKPGTIFTGYNSIRFDDEFMRYMMYRNFYDPYEWQWGSQRSKWDLLDLVRMTRALRPESIKWPYTPDGKPTASLEYMASINNLKHDKAHSALSDVEATIELARLVRSKQPKLFDFMLKMRQKSEIGKLVNSGDPFVYTSGKYSSQYEKTSIVGVVAKHPGRQGVLVFDLRYDPNDFAGKSVAELVAMWQERDENGAYKLPVKTLLFNRCPAIAPLSVVDSASQERLALNLDTVKANYKKLRANHALSKKLVDALGELDKRQSEMFAGGTDAEQLMYEGFISEADKPELPAVRSANPEDLNAGTVKFSDERLQSMLPRYKARNYPEYLSQTELEEWEKYRHESLAGGGKDSRLAKFGMRLQEFYAKPELSKRDKFLLEELKIYAESLV